MKLFRMLGRSIRDAIKSVIRNFSLSLASISCITITLIIVAIAIMASYNVRNFTKEIERDMTIVAFVDNDMSTAIEEVDEDNRVDEEDATEAVEEEINNVNETKTETITNIEKDLKKIKNVDKYTYQTKQEVKEQMQEESDVFDTVLSNWSDEESPLKDTFQVKVKDVEKLSETAHEIEDIDGIAVVRYGSGMVDKMVSAFNQIEKITYGIVIALVVVTVFLIINTIKLTISARKREISIMRLVGASNLTIKTPFIIEGMILGVFGSIIPIIITLFGYMAFYKHFDGYLYSRLIQLINPEPFIYQVSIAVLIIGIIVGMIGSASAVRRYLKV